MPTSTASSVSSPSLEKALKTIDANIALFDLAYPDDTTTDGFYEVRKHDRQYPDGSNYGWTTSFWPGQMWIAYELTEDPKYKAEALRHVEAFRDRVDEKKDLHTHDLGFLYTLACTVPWELAPEDPESAKAKEAALKAADALMVRYLEPAGVIQAWGDLSDENERGRVIIDSLMNMPLLFWASEQTGDPKYRNAAESHVRQLERNILREDDTTFHTYHFDAESGAAKHGSTAQGFADDSCWARGQAWGIYGFALAYNRLADEKLLAAAKRCADYYLAHLPEDSVPYWDLVFTDGSDQPRDSSSAAIAACGLLELADLLPEDADRYRAAARATAESLANNYAPSLEKSNALLEHSVYSLPAGSGVDEGSLWGDYFYMELLARILRADFKPHWSY